MIVNRLLNKCLIMLFFTGTVTSVRRLDWKYENSKNSLYITGLKQVWLYTHTYTTVLNNWIKSLILDVIWRTLYTLYVRMYPLSTFIYSFFPFIKTFVDTFVKNKTKTRQKKKKKQTKPTTIKHVMVMRTNYDTSWLKHKCLTISFY